MKSASNPEIVAIAAMSENRVIGKAGTIPWRVKADFQFWSDMSRGKPVIMGRKTFIDMPPSFKKRDKIFVVTRDKNWAFDGVKVVHSLNEAFDAAKNLCTDIDCDTIIIGGGGEIYKQALDQTDTIYLSTIHCHVDQGDAFFPELDETWVQNGEDRFHEKQDGDTAAFTIKKYVKTA